MAITHKKLFTTDVGSGGTPDVTFSNIPQTYDDLILLASMKTEAPGGAGSYGVRFEFNGSYSPVSFKRLYAGNGNVGSDSPSHSFLGIITGSAQSSTFSTHRLYIPNYTSSFEKISLFEGIASQSNEYEFDTITNVWENTAAITSIRIITSVSPAYDLAQYTTISLYGIKR